MRTKNVTQHLKMLRPNKAGVILQPYLLPPITATSLQVRFSSVPKFIVWGEGVRMYCYYMSKLGEVSLI